MEDGIGEELYALLKSSASMFLGRTLGRIGGLVGQILIVRALAPGMFGTIALAYTFVILSSRIVSNGFSEGVTRYISLASTEKEYQELFKAGATIALTLSIATATIFYIARSSLAAVLGNSGITPFIVLFVPYLLVFPLAQLFVADFRGRQQTTLPVVSEHIIGTGLGIAVFLGAVMVGNPESGAVLYWYMPPVMMTILLGYFSLQRYEIVSLIYGWPRWTAVRDLWSYSWPLLLSSSFAALLSNIDIVMISYFLDSVAVGEYRAVQPLRQVTLFLLSSITFLYLPLASKLYGEKQYRALTDLYKTTTKWVIAATLPFVLVLSLFARDTVITFFGVEYQGAAVALAALMVGTFSRTIFGPSGIMVKAIDRPRVEIIAAAAGLCVNLIANILLIPRYSILGAAVGTSVGITVFNVVEAIAIYRVTGGTSLSINAVKQLIPTTGIALVLAYALQGYQLGLFGLLIIGAILMVVQICSIVVTKSLDETDLELVDTIADRTGQDLTKIRSFILKYS